MPSARETADGHVVHGALAGRGNALRQGLGQRAQHDIGDALRCLDVAAGHGRGRLRIDDTVLRRDHGHRRKAAVVHGRVVVDQAAHRVIAGRLGDGDDCVERSVHDRGRAIEVEGDPVALDDGGDADRHQRNLVAFD